MQKKPKKAAFTALLALLAAGASLSAGGCGGPREKKYSAAYFDYFDTAATLAGYARSREEFDDISGFVESELARYDRIYDAYDSASGEDGLYYANLHAGEEPVRIDPDLFALLQFGKDACELTGGETNCALGGVCALWREKREAAAENPESAALPDVSELRGAAGHSDIDDIILDPDDCTVYYADPEIKCDVGAFAKGYCIERIAEELSERGVSGYLLNVGGNIRAIGPKPDGSPWTIAIENPDTDSDDAYIETIQTSDSALATSGSYQRYYTVGGRRYHHIIDPDTLFPADTFLSVSVLNGDAGIGDALSTALFNMSLEEGRSLVESMDETEAMWVLPDGGREYTEGFKKSVVNHG